MKKTNGKTILIFLLALVWLGFTTWLYIFEFEGNQSLELAQNDYSHEELYKLTRGMNNGETSTIRSGDFSISSEPELKNIVLDSKKDFEESQLQENHSFVVEPVVNNVLKPENNNVVTHEVIENKEIEVKEVIKHQCGNFFCYTSREFLDVYDNFIQHQNVDVLTKYIYQISEIDEYIKQKAEERGYKQRSFAHESDLIWFENVRTRPEVKKSYVALRNEMLQEGIRLHFVSGYRSSTSQRIIFKNKLNLSNPAEILTGIHDHLIDVALSRSAIPAYSKHHSGYAVDFGCGNDYLVYSFAETECYEWMSQNNFEKTKKYGFIPSYPDGIELQGPNPEPWEFVWVGVQNLK